MPFRGTKGSHKAVVPIVAYVLFLSARPAFGLPITFETLTDSEAVTTQFAAQGVVFANATALTAGISLNEFEFPPHSGSTVVFDDGGPMTLTFLTPFTQVEGFFTYNVPGGSLTLMAFDPSGALLATVHSGFSSNLWLTGDAGSSPNELLRISSLGPIGSVKILGDPGGSSFVLDDFNAAAPVPEPGTLVLLGTALAGLYARRMRRHRHTEAGHRTCGSSKLRERGVA